MKLAPPLKFASNRLDGPQQLCFTGALCTETMLIKEIYNKKRLVQLAHHAYLVVFHYFLGSIGKAL